MKVELTSEKTITITPAVTQTIAEITVITVLDYFIKKKVIAVTKELGHVHLWEDEDYDIIGQWTDQDVVDRLIELYS